MSAAVKHNLKNSQKDLWVAARQNMVDGQLRTNKITNPEILQAFSTLPREIFVSEHLQSLAYTDADVPLGGGRYMMQPMIAALMLQAVATISGARVAVIGAGSGYEVAVLAAMGLHITAIDNEERLLKAVEKCLVHLALQEHVTFKKSAMLAGDIEHAPFDVVMINGAVTTVPTALLAQLTERGCVVTVLRPDATKPGIVSVVYKNGTQQSIQDSWVPYLPGFNAQPGFTF